MAVKIQRELNEPILYVTLSGYVDKKEMHQMYDASARVADEWGRVYRLTDTVDLTGSFSELVQLMGESRELPGSPADPRVVAALVTSDMLPKIYAEGFSQEQYGSYNVPMFPDRDTAINYLREQMQKDAV